MTDLERRVAELERKMGCVVRYVHPAGGYSFYQCHHDLTHPPAPPPPEIKVVWKQGGYWVGCGDFWYSVFTGWVPPPHGTNFMSDSDAYAIAENLEREGNYPPGVKA